MSAHQSEAGSYDRHPKKKKVAEPEIDGGGSAAFACEMDGLAADFFYQKTFKGSPVGIQLLPMLAP